MLASFLELWFNCLLGNIMNDNLARSVSISDLLKKSFLQYLLKHTRVECHCLPLLVPCSININLDVSFQKAVIVSVLQNLSYLFSLTMIYLRFDIFGLGVNDKGALDREPRSLLKNEWVKLFAEIVG